MGLLNKLDKKVLIFDGAMGTMLQKAGLVGGELPELYNVTKPEIVKSIHKAYIEAGADIITANTFGANRYKIDETDFSVKEVIKAGIDIAKSVANGKLVALDVSSIGKLMEPIGTLSFDDAYDVFKEQVVAGEEAGADLILLETFSDLQETRAAILACKENTKLPVICTMTFQDNGRTLTGTDPKTFVNVVQDLGVDVLGVNCSLGPEELTPIVKEILEWSLIPVIIQPNAGLPALVNNETVFKLESPDFVSLVKPLIDAGVSIVGGCCGTDPNFIKQLSEAYKEVDVVKRNVKRVTTVCSSTETVVVNGRVKIIGERINPTGKKKLKEALRNRKYEYVINEAISQVEAGADMLDINVGLPEIDEKEVMLHILKELDGIVKVPLQIDSTKPEVIEAACRYYNGKTIINSVNGKQSSMDTVLPIAKKYGASVIALVLDEEGLPETTAKRVEIAERIINEAKKYGISEERIFVDNLVLTASAQQEGVRQTLQAITDIKAKYNVRTTLGASNVSFGLPNRHIINKTFLVMAMTHGLDAPIMDPTTEGSVDHIRAFEVLNYNDVESRDYIAYMDSKKEDGTIVKPQDKNESKDLQTIIIKGLKEEVEPKTEELLKALDPMEVVDNYLIPALDIVGVKFDKGEIYLPQLIRSAETVKRAFDIIKAQLLKEGAEEISNGKIILATVKGDIHDIGKNIVKVILENYGFHIIDLGKDVPPELIVETIKKENVRLVGLSALMTTTVVSMEETIKLIREENLDCKVVVGGAVLTPEYAEMIKADFFCRDARETAKVAKDFFNVKE